MGPAPSRLLRVAAVACLAVAVLDALLAKQHIWSKTNEGWLLVVSGLALIVVHVLFDRGRPGPTQRPELLLAGVLGAVLLPLGLVLLFLSPAAYFTYSAYSTVPFIGLLGVSGRVAGDALLISSLVYAAAYVFGRHPRWLTATPLALIVGADLRIQGAATVGGPSWGRFILLAAGVLVLEVLGERLGDEEGRNLKVAGALLVPLVYITAPTARHPGTQRDVILAVMLGLLALLASRRLTVGIGAALVVMVGVTAYEIVRAGSLVPAIVAAAIAVVLLVAAERAPILGR
jgi:hypothetical protein